ncbi:LysR family transcriptional regulator [Vibrio sonorensis]|uniref:LysR family transcriptional regulator n=1 Tax=Vibrio sonorensis TaxID=1004316 RepID=UPI0008D94CFB|nr:LysR family transcriptional regulator [Vibrio sonorensis]
MNYKVLPLLKYFHALSQTGSFTKAAEQLSISQSTVSTQIQKLEHYLQVKLLTRKSKHQFTLTQEGQTLAEEVAHLLGSLNNQLEQLQQVEPSHANLTISASTSVGTAVLLPIIAKLQNRYPDLMLHLQENASKKRFFEDGIDIATNYGVADETFHSVYLMEVKKYLVCSAGYALKHGYPTDLKAVTKHRLIAQADGKHEWHSLFARSHIEIGHPQIQLVSSNLAKLEAIKLGLGIGLLPHYLCDPNRKDLLVIEEIDVSCLNEPLYLICEKRRKNEGKIHWLMSKLEQEFSEQ